MHVRNHNKGTILIFRCAQSELYERIIIGIIMIIKCGDATMSYCLQLRYSQSIPCFRARTGVCVCESWAKGLNEKMSLHDIAGERMTNITQHFTFIQQQIMENVRQIS